jgi:hypothetical protein
MSLVGGDPFAFHANEPKKNWGEVNGVDVPPTTPTGIKLLNGVWWINVFGRKYIDFFGESVVLSTPAYHARFIEDGDWIWLQTTKRPEEMFSSNGSKAAEAIKQHLGRPRAFFGYDPTIPSFLATYDTPAFDFSDIRSSPKT